MNPVEISERNGPIILSQPHGGTFLPRELSKRLNERGLTLADTDWHINRLYDNLLLGATVVQATFSRYLIDANRDPSGASLYPGQNTTGLCPTVDFDGLPIYKDETEPSAEEIETRRKNYHAVYHSALSEQIERVHKKHGFVLLFDCQFVRRFLFCLKDNCQILIWERITEALAIQKLRNPQLKFIPKLRITVQC